MPVFYVQIAKNVIEYPKSNRNSFSFQLSDLKLDGLTTPIVLGNINDAKNVYSQVLTPLRKDAETYVLTLPEVNSEKFTTDLTKSSGTIIHFKNKDYVVKDDKIVYENITLGEGKFNIPHFLGILKQKKPFQLWTASKK